MRTIALSLALLLAACGSAAGPARDELAGVYKIAGGDSSLEIVQALTDAFAAKHPGVKFDIDPTLGSDPAITLSADGSLDLGMASRYLTPDEAKLVETQLIGVAGTGIAVNAQNPLRSITSAMVLDIYTGKITDWSSLGGTPGTIIPLVREPGSSARTTFETGLFASAKPAYAATVLEIHEGEQMRQAIASYRHSVGMIGVKSEDPKADGVRLLSVDGVMPTKSALRDGTYKFGRPLYLLVSKTKRPKAAIAALLEFVNSADGQKILDRF
jgi:phosphate transport system substrate-binding protein